MGEKNCELGEIEEVAVVGSGFGCRDAVGLAGLGIGLGTGVHISWLSALGLGGGHGLR